jgi:hypothetical protein
VILLKRGSLTIPSWANNGPCDLLSDPAGKKIAKMWATKIMIYHSNPPVKIMEIFASIEIAALFSMGNLTNQDVV